MTSVPIPKRVKRSATSEFALPDTMSKAEAIDKLEEETKRLSVLAKEQAVYTEQEIDDVTKSLQNIAPSSFDLDTGKLKAFLTSAAHLSHKDWHRTADNSKTLQDILMSNGMSDEAKQIFSRILRDGNWKGAEEGSSEHPWAVLVTGVNGIRKTTSLYQPWFPKLLAEALIVPDEGSTLADKTLPTGQNAFFRQLDHMIATLTNEHFARLYSLTKDSLGGSSDIPQDVVQRYSDFKASIFSRYRTLSELLGVALLRQAHDGNLSCMLETSGRDVAMFEYMDIVFPNHYRKLVLHFQINDLSFAKSSVDQRMKDEINLGVEALGAASATNIIDVNQGGPYGSDVLEGVQKDSDSVWQSEVLPGKVGKDWYKATIQINAADDNWTAQAVKSDGTLGTSFTFEKR